MQRLLLMSCGKRKRHDVTLLPALERYDGPPFRVLRRYLAAHPASPPDIFILSAKFGLIPADQPIPYYDQRLTPQRTTELRPAVHRALAPILARGEYEQIYLAVGRDYAHALDGSAALASAMASVTVAHGSQGKRLAQLHDWLYGPATEPVLRASGASGVPRAMLRTNQSQRHARLRGVEIALTAPQALARARQTLATDPRGSECFHSWYVLLEKERIAPKWLVSQLSGLPVGAFTTHEALQVLAQIGIVVHRADMW